MASIYNLVQSPDMLESANRGISRNQYEQQAPTRDVGSGNFPNGSINFRWQTSGVKWWIPSRSYIRMRCSLTKADGVTPVDDADDVAPNMDQCAALFQSLEFRINDKVVSRVADYVAQIDALSTRINKPSAWIDSVGASTNFWNDSFAVRKVTTSVNGQAFSSVPIVDSQESLAIDAGTTIEYVAATGILTFGVGVNVTANFAVGDYIRFSYALNAGNADYRIQAIPDPTQLILTNGPAGDVGAGVKSFARVRYENEARRAPIYEITWTPPLSIFQVEHALPCGRFELVMNPQTSSVYKKAAVESNVADRTPGAGGDYDFNIENMFLYINTVEGERCDALTYFLDLTQIACQAESLAGAVSFGQKAFDVSPATKALCVAFQDTRAGTNTLVSATKFRGYPAVINKSSDQGLRLNRLFVNYSGRSVPNPDSDPTFDTSVDRTTQRYLDSIMGTGSYFGESSETIQAFHNRGSYHYFPWSKDSNDRSTRVSVNTGFISTGGTDLSNTRLLLFSISSQIAKVTIENGSVTNVDVQDN